ncbi:F0F1 ATP synthase subunit alpha [Candidatus Beckwithbacteria bacterium RBG_13_42_9]|uniref:ATP synthase subunit alpha n=1 Tax=Candidatus Beckwithbacteria bacterium RBG_13_42_9 TaxID=1797457 RepID=A0A1F5E8X6_9BACT|nr:MAG: F0F1 ATP synthase subunit alpha [Candidatus Beckwithbacteria bacterium RBG_13_42_9]
MKLVSSDIAHFLEQEIEHFQTEPKVKTIGKVVENTDGVVRVTGLSDVTYGEIVDFGDGILGYALNLEKDLVGIVVLGDYTKIMAGHEVKTTGRTLNIGVSEELLGRAVNPLGMPLDGQPAPTVKSYMPLEKIAPGIIVRQAVNTPVHTGIKAIDSMIPIGRGQRELIVGDRATGKSSIGLTTIINQKGQNMICIYVAIGQKNSSIAQFIENLKRFKAFEYTIIVAANASDPASMQYLAPLAGCAIGEYFAEKGKDALVIYDDLTKHAWAYREMSLLMRRPTGREAYPGDIFYLHSSLLERALRYNQANGNGSLTALPIIETQAGDYSAYIPTNVISITDGQIYLETDLFNAGIKPAINAGASVSRVGGSAQLKATKQVAGKVRLDLAQYRSMAAFAQFASDLDEATRKQIERGKRLMEVMKQGWDEPCSVADQVFIFWATNNGFLDDVPIEDIKRFEKELLGFMARSFPKIGREIMKEKQISEKLEREIKEAVETFKSQFLPTKKEEIIKSNG